MKFSTATVLLLSLVAGICRPLALFAKQQQQVPADSQLTAFFPYLLPGLAVLLAAFVVFLFLNNRRMSVACRLLSEENTKLQEVEEELRRELSRLELANENLNNFIFAASHDLKESVRSVASFGQLLERKLISGERDNTAGHYTRYIIEGGMRMNNTLEKLVIFSELAGKEQPGRSVVDLEQAARKAWNELLEKQDHGPLSLTIGLLPKATGDPALVYRLLNCLLENAIEFRNEEQPLWVGLYYQPGRKNKSSAFVLTDNGLGVGPEYLESIFEPFKRLHPRGKGGAGLGLSICRRIVEMHKGNIWAEPAEEGGLAVYFTLPVAEARTPELAHS